MIVNLESGELPIFACLFIFSERVTRKSGSWAAGGWPRLISEKRLRVPHPVVFRVRFLSRA